MNCGILLYRSFNERELTYTMDCSDNFMTDMMFAFLLAVSSIFKQLSVSQTDYVLHEPVSLHFASSLRIPHSSF